MAKRIAKKTGRPPKDSPLSTSIGLKLTPEDKALLQKAADSARRSIADWARLTLTDAARAELGLPPVAAPPA